jgi:hypothetical protein
MDALIDCEVFWDNCRRHHKDKMHVFCFDCETASCNSCSMECQEAGHNIIQIRKASGCNAIRLSELTANGDPFRQIRKGVQEYVINSSVILFI